MNRFLTTTLTAALAGLLPATMALAQKPSSPASRPAPAAGSIPPFQTAETDAHSWVGRFGSTNCAWLDMGEGVLLIDTGANAEDAKNLLAEVKRTDPGKPIRWVVMTHLHRDSNWGFSAMLPLDATLIVNARALRNVENLVREAQGKALKVVGVTDKLVLITRTRTLEIQAAPGPAHTDQDLWVWAPATGVVYVGDLVTPDRCPMASDPAADPTGWITVLNTIESLHAQHLVATRGPDTMHVAQEIERTRDYLKRTLDILQRMKAENAPEARVSGELFARKLGDYCPSRLDSINGLELYRRMKPDGTFAAPNPARPTAARQ
jgi:glyoxylase-like metal-dependent hydrolase (beta-lactamase superfamily II)